MNLKELLSRYGKSDFCHNTLHEILVILRLRKMICTKLDYLAFMVSRMTLPWYFMAFEYYSRLDLS